MAKWQSKKDDGFIISIASLKWFNNGHWSIGCLLLKPSSHNKSTAPYLGNHKTTKVFPEVCLGYFLHQPDLQFNFTFRSIKSELNAYGFSQVARHRALTFEIYKSFCDYKGFDAFVGTAFSYENLYISETNQAGITSTGK